MDDLQIKWVPQKGRLQSGKDAMIGKVKIGSISYDGMTSKDDINKFAAYCTLPGMKARQGHFLNDREAADKIEFVWRHWLSMLKQ